MNKAIAQPRLPVKPDLRRGLRAVHRAGDERDGASTGLRRR
jgi:hypothetical protein